MKVGTFSRRVRWAQRLVAVSFVLALALIGLGQSHAAPSYTPILYDVAPAQGAVVSGPSVRLGATIRSNNGNPITSWQVTIDGQNYQMVQPVVRPDGLQVLLYNYVPLGNGPHNVYVEGIDSTGVAGGYAWSFTVTNGGPPPPTPTPLPSGKLPSFSGLTPADSATVSGSPIRIAVTIASNASLINESLILDGHPYNLLGVTHSSGEMVYADINGLSVGQHNVVVQANDTAGNFNAQPWSFTVQLCPPGRIYFSQTGRCVSTGFYQFWVQNGDVNSFGYPISDEFATTLADGKTYSVQYFERARFEYHPEAPDPYKVQLGLLGQEIHGVDARTSPAAGLRYFQETGHGVPDKFLQYWLNNNGQAVFGYPISEPRNEVNPTDGKTYAVQYFQRARFEYHPELPAGQDVLLGLLGKQIYQQKYPGR